MFDSLSDKLEGALRSLSGQGRITELNIAESMREIRRALLDADVNYQVAKDFTERIKEQALGTDVLNAVSPGQQLVKIVYDELVHFLGSTHEEVSFSAQPPTVILIAGLQGSGKTTFSGKLAHYFKGKGRSPMLAAADVYRPAAVDQLKTLAESIGVPVYALEEDGRVVQDPVRIAKEAVQAARKQARDILIIDTAGRLHVDERMMKEVADIKAVVNPDEILFVVDAMTGQDAVNTALEFNQQLNFDGVVLTKLDGDTRGGAALSRNRSSLPLPARSSMRSPRSTRTGWRSGYSAWETWSPWWRRHRSSLTRSRRRSCRRRSGRRVSTWRTSSISSTG